MILRSQDLEEERRLCRNDLITLFHECFNILQDIRVKVCIASISSSNIYYPRAIFREKQLPSSETIFPSLFHTRTMHEIDANESKGKGEWKSEWINESKKIVQSLSSYRILPPPPAVAFFPWARVSARMERTEIYASSGAIVNRRNLFASRNWPEEYNIDTVGYLRRGWWHLSRFKCEPLR